eukprot:RCo043933
MQSPVEERFSRQVPEPEWPSDRQQHAPGLDPYTSSAEGVEAQELAQVHPGHRRSPHKNISPPPYAPVDISSEAQAKAAERARKQQYAEELKLQMASNARRRRAQREEDLRPGPSWAPLKGQQPVPLPAQPRPHALPESVSSGSPQPLPMQPHLHSPVEVSNWPPPPPQPYTRPSPTQDPHVGYSAPSGPVQPTAPSPRKPPPEINPLGFGPASRPEAHGGAAAFGQFKFKSPEEQDAIRAKRAKQEALRLQMEQDLALVEQKRQQARRPPREGHLEAPPQGHPPSSFLPGPAPYRRSSLPLTPSGRPGGIADVPPAHPAQWGGGGGGGYGGNDNAGHGYYPPADPGVAHHDHPFAREPPPPPLFQQQQQQQPLYQQQQQFQPPP